VAIRKFIIIAGSQFSPGNYRTHADKHQTLYRQVN